MSDLNYAIDILKDDLNELRQMQAVPRYAMEGKLYIERTNSLHAAIEKLEKANGVNTGEKQCNLPVVNIAKRKVCSKCGNKDFFGDADTGKYYCDVCGKEQT